MTTPSRLYGRSFVVYYGRGPLEGVDGYDIAILEPSGWTTPHHRHLQKDGVKTLAYLSALEVPPWRVPETGLQDEDFVMIGGERFLKQPFGNWLANPRSRRWKRYVVETARSLYQRGWDGLFLDTLGDVEDEQLSATWGWLIPATAELVQLIRGAFPSRPLIVNNGLWRLVPLIAPLIDGVCWEGNLTTEQLKEPWAQAMIEFLGRGAQERGWANMMLSHIPSGSLAAAERLRRFQEDAERYGFLAYAAPADYAESIRLKNGRVASSNRP